MTTPKGADNAPTAGVANAGAGLGPGDLDAIRSDVITGRRLNLAAGEALLAEVDRLRAELQATTWNAIDTEAERLDPGHLLRVNEDLRLHIGELAAKLAATRAELARLQSWVNDLQSGMYVNCVYCGHRYGPDPGTPIAMADVLKSHIEQCPQHPMSALKAELAAERKNVAVLTPDLPRVCRDCGTLRHCLECSWVEEARTSRVDVLEDPEVEQMVVEQVRVAAAGLDHPRDVTKRILAALRARRDATNKSKEG